MLDAKNLALLLACLSLVWNLANTIYTHRRNKKNRTLAIQLEEFRTKVRGPIDTILERLEEIEVRIELLIRSNLIAPDVEADLASLNKDMVGEMVRLDRRLEAADRSKFFDSSALQDYFYSKEDIILSLANDGLNEEASKNERIKALSGLMRQINLMQKKITTDMENQINQLA